MNRTLISHTQEGAKVAAGFDFSSLESCDQEPIRKPAKIQVDGAVLIFVDLRHPPIAYSENVFQFFDGGEENQLHDIENFQLDALFDAQDIVRLHKCLVTSEKHARPANLHIKTKFKNVYSEFLCLCHRLQRHLFFEFIPTRPYETIVATEDGDVSFEFFLSDLISRARILQHSHSQDTDSLGELGDYFVDAMRCVTGFDRVKLYRFLPDWSGEVIAESVNPSKQVASYLGLHFPESDIPSQARALYQLTPFRYISDTHATAVPLVNAQALHSGNASRESLSLDHLDMTFCFLRSVSPIHIQYLRNMGVRSSASFSIMVNGQLWGLIACHHCEANPIFYEKLIQAEIVVQQLSSALVSRFQGEMLRMHHQIAGVFRRISAAMNRDVHIFEALQQNGALLMGLCSATGFAVCLDAAYVRVGSLPSDEVLSMLSQWLEPKMVTGHYITDHLVSELPIMSTEVGTSAGILAVGGMINHGSSGRAFKLIWFRSEVIRDVTWAGQPVKACDEHELAPDEWDRVKDGGGFDNQIPDHLHPRQSFANWKEIMRERCNRWDSRYLSAAKELYSAIVQVMAPQYFRLERLNEKLEETVGELEHFSRAVAHDLRGPLRALLRMPSWVRQAMGRPDSDAEVFDYINRMEVQAKRMETLLQDLLTYSTLDHGPVEVDTIDLHREIDEYISINCPDEELVFEYLDEPLPLLHAPRTEIRLIVANLITNALKHHHQPKSCVIRVSIEGCGEEFVTVRFEDNGPGIEPQYREKVLQAFTTLKPKDSCEGSGLGLAILNKLVRRYGGTMSVTQSALKSAPSEGAKPNAQKGDQGYGVCVSINYPRDVRLISKNAMTKSSAIEG